MKKILIMAFLGLYISAGAQTENREAVQAWINAVTSSSVYTEKLYTENAILVEIEKNILKTVETDRISDFFKSKGWHQVESLRSTGAADASSNIAYEIVTFNTGNESYKEMIIWNQKDGGSLRELDVIAQSEGPGRITPGALDAPRAEWIRLCGEHEPLKLVTEMYTSDALYYNHKPMVVGTDAIAEEYWYMGNASYQLNLTPIVIEMLSPTLAFEIGQCSGSYKGKYMLVWVKGDDGEWRVALDSNI